MSCTKECPICMENICGDKNCVTTDCGHNFHASCLFKNMAHNGFGCPYCRTELAEVPEEDEDSEDEDDDDDWIDDDDEPYSNSSLRRVREMFQEDYNAADDVEEDEDEEDEEDGYFHGEEDYENAPTSQLMAAKLMEKGVTYDQLVESLCSSNLDEYRFKMEYNATSDKIYGKMRGILANYVQTQTNVPTVNVTMENQ